MFPDFIEEINIKNEVVKMPVLKPKRRGRPRKVVEETPGYEKKLDELQKIRQHRVKPIPEKLAELQLELGKVIFNASRYPTMAHWAKAINKLSYDATLIAIESDMQGEAWERKTFY